MRQPCQSGFCQWRHLPSWRVPAIKAPDQLNGFGLSFVYPNETAGAIDYRSVQVYWDLLRTGEYAFTFASSSSDDGLVITQGLALCCSSEIKKQEYSECAVASSCIPCKGDDSYDSNMTTIVFGPTLKVDVEEHLNPKNLGNFGIFFCVCH